MKKRRPGKDPARKALAEKRQMIWERIDQRARSTSPNLTVDRIVRVGIPLADREGIEALSMRRIAAELQSGVMSLYYYVPAKGDLLDLLLDEIMGEVKLPAKLCGDWRQDLRRVALQTRRCLKRHPWALALLSSRPAYGPNRLAHLEFALGVVSGLGLNRYAVWQAVGSLYAYVLGFMAFELSEAHALCQAGFECVALPYLLRLFKSGKYPHLAQFHAAGPTLPPDNEAFTAGLDLVLQGIAALVPKQGKAPLFSMVS